jgi:CheY-like chemotaxis protein
MRSYKIIFFENYPEEEPNRTFRINLLRSSFEKKVAIVDAITLKAFENTIKDPSFIYSPEKKLIILDLMMRLCNTEKRFRWKCNDNQVDDSLIGAALLERLRTGYYDLDLKDIPIFIRTVNTSPIIKNLCLNFGATDYFITGAQDSLLLSAISKIIK